MFRLDIDSLIEVANLEKIIIHGQRPLRGEVEINGSKNAAVAILPATLLAEEPCIIENVPDVSDVRIIIEILKKIIQIYI